jgi:hypothetical protein
MDVVNNIRENEELVNSLVQYADVNDDMFSFILNPDNLQGFDQAAYTWLKSNGPSIPNAGNYLRPMKSQDILQKVLTAKGWIDFRKGMDAIDAESIRTGVPIELSPELQEAKKDLVSSIKEDEEYGSVWFSEYATIDPAKFTNRAEMLELAISNPIWISKNASKPLTKAIAVFITQRNLIKASLYATNSTLSRSPELSQEYQLMVMKLKEQSIEFSDFYNRYFEGDTVI